MAAHSAGTQISKGSGVQTRKARGYSGFPTKEYDSLVVHMAAAGAR